jgi:hypothetical protein
MRSEKEGEAEDRTAKLREKLKTIDLRFGNVLSVPRFQTIL